MYGNIPLYSETNTNLSFQSCTKLLFNGQVGRKLGNKVFDVNLIVSLIWCLEFVDIFENTTKKT